MQIVHKIPENSFIKRLEFCNKLVKILNNNNSIINNIWFTDESHFYLDGYINKQNMRICRQQYHVYKIRLQFIEIRKRGYL